MNIIKHKIVGPRAAKKAREERELLAYEERKRAKEKIYNGTVEIHGTEEEYLAMHRLRDFGYKKRMRDFIQESLENLESLDELIVIDSGTEEVAKYTEVTLKEEDKKALQKGAKKAGLDVKDFVRAVLWTNRKNLIDQHELQEEKRKEFQRLSNGIASNLFISGELLKKIEVEYGKITTSQKLNEVLPKILKDHYKIK